MGNEKYLETFGVDFSNGSYYMYREVGRIVGPRQKHFFKIFLIEIKDSLIYRNTTIFSSRICIYICACLNAEMKFMSVPGKYLCMVAEDGDPATMGLDYRFQ